MKKVKNSKSPFSIFVKESIDAWKKDNPTQTVLMNDHLKICSGKWKSLDEKEKEQYIRLAKDDRQRFNKEMAETDDIGKAVKKSAKSCHPNKPKRNKNSFFLFCDQEKKKVQDQMPNAKSQEVRKELAIRWKKAPDNVKIKFKNRAKDLQREYSKKLKKFHEKNKNNKKGLGTFKPTTEKNSDSEDEDTDSD